MAQTHTHGTHHTAGVQTDVTCFTSVLWILEGLTLNAVQCFISKFINIFFTFVGLRIETAGFITATFQLLIKCGVYFIFIFSFLEHIE